MRVVLFSVTALAVLLTSSCGGGGGQKAEAPPKPGTLAYDWYAANENWKKGDYQGSMEHLSRLAVAQSEYREKSKIWQMVVAGGIAQGYNELADEYAKMAKGNTDYRRQAMEVRNAANVAAMQFAEAVHEGLTKNKDAKIAFDFPFPKGSGDLPLQFSKISKNMSMQPADHQVAREKMAERGVVKFAAALAGSPDDLAKAATQFAAPARDAALGAVAKGLISAADLYDRRKLDVPQRGNALAREASEAVSLMGDSKEKKDLDKQAQEALKKYKVAS